MVPIGTTVISEDTSVNSINYISLPNFLVVQLTPVVNAITANHPKCKCGLRHKTSTSNQNSCIRQQKIGV